MGYWFIKPENIKGDGSNTHIFKGDKESIYKKSLCGEELLKANGTYYGTMAELKTAIKNSGRELCAKCPGIAVHTDL